MVKGHNEIIILFMNCQDDVHIVVFFLTKPRNEDKKFDFQWKADICDR